jgi:hypothetical protein
VNSPLYKVHTAGSASGGDPQSDDFELSAKGKPMRKKTILGVIAMCSLLLPVAAVAADGAPTPSTIASQICKQEKVTLGANFKNTYGTNANKSNAFGKCVSKNARNAQADVANAAKACDAERTADAAAFASKYGKNKNDKNAFGKCVSAKATASAAAHAAAATSASKQCKAAAKADAAGYAAKYGTGKDALGRCVAAKSQAK